MEHIYSEKSFTERLGSSLKGGAIGTMAGTLLGGAAGIGAGTALSSIFPGGEELLGVLDSARDGLVSIMDSMITGPTPVEAELFKSGGSVASAYLNTLQTTDWLDKDKLTAFADTLKEYTADPSNLKLPANDLELVKSARDMVATVDNIKLMDAAGPAILDNLSAFSGLTIATGGVAGAGSAALAGGTLGTAMGWAETIKSERVAAQTLPPRRV